jgi:hypothetical protein
VVPSVAANSFWILKIRRNRLSRIFSGLLPILLHRARRPDVKSASVVHYGTSPTDLEQAAHDGTSMQHEGSGFKTKVLDGTHRRIINVGAAIAYSKPSASGAI